MLGAEGVLKKAGRTTAPLKHSRNINVIGTENLLQWSVTGGGGAGNELVCECRSPYRPALPPAERSPRWRHERPEGATHPSIGRRDWAHHSSRAGRLYSERRPASPLRGETMCGALSLLASVCLLALLQERWHRLTRREQVRLRNLLDWAYLCLILLGALGLVGVLIRI